MRLHDGSFLVTGEVSEDGGTFVREGDPFQPVKSWVDEERSVVGGLLPPGAVSVDVVDDRGTRVAAAVAYGVYVAMLEHPPTAARQSSAAATGPAP